MAAILVEMSAGPQAVQTSGGMVAYFQMIAFCGAAGLFSIPSTVLLLYWLKDSPVWPWLIRNSRRLAYSGPIAAALFVFWTKNIPSGSNHSFLIGAFALLVYFRIFFIPAVWVLQALFLWVGRKGQERRELQLNLLLETLCVVGLIVALRF